MFVHFIFLSFDRFMAPSESKGCGLMLPLTKFCLRKKILAFVSIFGNTLFRKSNNVVHFQLAIHITV